MARVVESKKALSVYPLKLSQPLGAMYAFMGVKGSIPLIHGSQGCASFAKTFLTRHFWENIPVQTTALSQIATVMGNDDVLHTALKNVIERAKPEVVAVITTGVTETRGDYTEGSIKLFRELYPDFRHVEILCVHTPDYEGSFHTGYKEALLSIVKNVVRTKYATVPDQVNLIVSYSLTAEDIDTLKELLELFGLKVIVLPDISMSMDGGVLGFSSVIPNGTALRDIQRMSSSTITIAVGESAKAAGEYLEKEFMIPMYYFEHLMGIESYDELIRLLINLTGRDLPERVKRWRNRLLDMMIDSHFYLSKKRVAIAGEPDYIIGLSQFLAKELGMVVSLAVTTVKTESLETLPVEDIIVGDLEDILNSKKDFDLLIGNTNLRHVASKLNVPHYRVGIPIFDRLGHFLKGFIGYKGSTYFTMDIANLLMEREEEESYRVPDYVKRRYEQC
ncbi:nitrogenase molybdenum-iron cofactor biosynthesis protein NifN [Thermocrinis albus DSM 14484]|uniref:Nitrogenase iron-molybdenum cofactor biosynthesis protein NifN n=1 Tax=Thermocrinis albus (strain DSM 14484 / JCM 11386 / HI 11/12) TaxID=638303 RepID=D3SPH8_THEAH|nr:nitrogenase iron-molybdenum cofactor biosynthesis protein NifN [Thermocrinis albus]ADC89065.1 nitrogenase molybdenum-iron cofactor biosynthesis protein NifN [Thermocrinis albus DSM 14484]